MKKRVFVLFLCAVVIVMLSGCGNMPPVGGTSTESDSSSESIPSVPIHEHTWIEANYQEPKTCAECEEAEGDPLIPAFEQAGYTINMTEIGTDYPYTTVCGGDHSVTTVASVTISDYEIIESDETHEAKDSFEWRIIQVDYLFDDDNARAQGWTYHQALFDYYNEFLETERDDEFNQGFDEETISINYFGEAIECISRYEPVTDAEWHGNGSDSYLTLSRRLSVCVPIGYDGIVLAVANAIHQFDENGELMETSFLPRSVDENTLFFRLKNI